MRKAEIIKECLDKIKSIEESRWAFKSAEKDPSSVDYVIAKSGAHKGKKVPVRKKPSGLKLQRKEARSARNTQIKKAFEPEKNKFISQLVKDREAEIEKEAKKALGKSSWLKKKTIHRGKTDAQLLKDKIEQIRKAREAKEKEQISHITWKDPSKMSTEEKLAMIHKDALEDMEKKIAKRVKKVSPLPKRKN